MRLHFYRDETFSAWFFFLFIFANKRKRPTHARTWDWAPGPNLLLVLIASTILVVCWCTSINIFNSIIKMFLVVLIASEGHLSATGATGFYTNNIIQLENSVSIIFLLLSYRIAVIYYEVTWLLEVEVVGLNLARDSIPGAGSETYAPVWTWHIVGWLPISLIIFFWWRHELCQLW